MKTLILMRHAEAMEQRFGQTDFDRELSDAGRLMAEQTALILSQVVPRVDRIIASAAIRTTQTAEIVQHELKTETLVSNLDLYQASPNGYISVLHHTMSDDENFAIMVGHNPTLAHLLCGFAGQSISVTPSTLAVFEFSIESWGELRSAELRSDRRGNCQMTCMIHESRRIL